MTGELITATLDGLPVALAGGFVPDAWRGMAEIAVVSGGRAVAVLNMANLTYAPLAADGVTAAALASGRVLTPGAPVGSATALPERMSQQVQQAATTFVTGGDSYDQGRFLGTEYRKKSAQGQPVSIDGAQWAVGQRSSDQQNWASARTAGLAATSGVTIGIGRTLPAAIELLKQPSTRIVETADGQIQLYDAGRLVAVYDSQNGVAGDTNGTPNASSEQMAAIIAYHALHPQNAYDRGLAHDLAAALDGSGRSLAAIDAAYLVLTNGLLAGTGTLTLGAQVGTRRCPACGEFMGDAHICRSAGQPPAAPSAPGRGVVAEERPADPPSAGAVPETGEPGSAGDTRSDYTTPRTEDYTDAPDAAPAPASAPGEPQITVQLDPQAFATALASVLPSQQQLDPQAFAAALASALAAQPAPQVNLQLDPAAIGDAVRAGMAAAPAPQVTVHVPPPTAQVQLQVDSAQLADALRAGLGSALNDVASGRGDQPAATPVDAAAAPARPPRQGRQRPAGLPATGQEHMLSKIRLPAPDPYLSDVPASVGGRRGEPLQEFIPDIDPNYAISENTEAILKSISALMQASGRVTGTARRACMAFGLYGPPGTGKNTLARQVAASIQTLDQAGNATQGMNYAEVNILPDSSIEDMIGTVVLEPDGRGGTRSVVRLGKIGLAAAMGSVVCVNEIVRNPKLATALQSILEDGEIIIASPEAGQVTIPVHPATTLFLTWNPGNEGDADRPAQAPLSRITTFKLDKASDTERAQRAMSFLAQFDGQSDGANGSQQAQHNRRRQEITRRDYGIPDKIVPSAEEVKSSVKFLGAIEKLADAGVGAKQIGLASATSTAPGDRQLARFLVLGKTVGWQQAAEMFKICCDQGEDFPSQWALIEERFRANFLKPDGTPVNFNAPPAQR
jgi:MoxR-like ATPase